MLGLIVAVIGLWLAVLTLWVFVLLRKPRRLHPKPPEPRHRADGPEGQRRSL